MTLQNSHGFANKIIPYKEEKFITITGIVTEIWNINTGECEFILGDRWMIIVNAIVSFLDGRIVTDHKSLTICIDLFDILINIIMIKCF